MCEIKCTLKLLLHASFMFFNVATRMVKITCVVYMIFLLYSAALAVQAEGVVVLYIEVNLAISSHKI